MKKYNIKIKKIFKVYFFIGIMFFVLGVIPTKIILADMDICVKYNGTCQAWCSNGYKELRTGSVFCANNIIQDTCCIPDNTSVVDDAPATDDSMTSCKSSDGKRSGNCEFGECSAGLTLIPSSTDCWLGRNCCGLPVSSNTQTVSSNTNLGQNTNSNPSSNNQISTGTVGCCSTNCSTSKSGCAEENWYANVNCAEVPSCKAYSSQCSTTNSDGTQSGCTNKNDTEILNSQCKATYKGEESVCSSMSLYLNKMASECKSLKSAGSLGVQGINCDAIANGGVYGSEASKFSNYLISGSSNGESAGGTTATSGAGGLDFDTIAAMGLPDSSGVKSVLVNVMKWMLEIIGLITLIAFIISGGQYLLSAGDDTMMQKAKKNMTYSIIGIIVALSGFVIIRAVDMALRATSSMF